MKIVISSVCSEAFPTVGHCDIIRLWVVRSSSRHKLLLSTNLSSICLSRLLNACIFGHCKLVDKWTFPDEILSLSILIRGAIWLFWLYWAPTFFAFGWINLDVGDSRLDRVGLIKDEDKWATGSPKVHYSFLLKNLHHPCSWSALAESQQWTGGHSGNWYPRSCSGGLEATCAGIEVCKWLQMGFA